MAIKNIKKLFTKSAATASTAVLPVKAVVVKKAVAKKSAEKAVSKKVVSSSPAAKKAVSKKTVAAKKVAVKKVVQKKVTVKKTTAKAVPKKSATKRLVVASDSESFWVNDGQVLNSLVALEMAFKTMKPAAFSHHLTKDSNHFAEWVEAVLMDRECALALRSAKNAAAAHIIVAKHLKTYTK